MQFKLTMIWLLHVTFRLLWCLVRSAPAQCLLRGIQYSNKMREETALSLKFLNKVRNHFSKDSNYTRFPCQGKPNFQMYTSTELMVLVRSNSCLKVHLLKPRNLEGIDRPPRQSCLRRCTRLMRHSSRRCYGRVRKSHLQYRLIGLQNCSLMSFKSIGKWLYNRLRSKPCYRNV